MKTFHFLYDNLILSWLHYSKGNFSPNEAYFKLLIATAYNILSILWLPAFFLAKTSKAFAENGMVNGIAAFVAAVLLSVLVLAYLKRKKFVESVAMKYNALTDLQKQQNSAHWKLKGWTMVFALPVFTFILILMLDKYVCA